MSPFLYKIADYIAKRVTMRDGALIPVYQSLIEENDKLLSKYRHVMNDIMSRIESLLQEKKAEPINTAGGTGWPMMYLKNNLYVARI